MFKKLRSTFRRPTGEEGEDAVPVANVGQKSTAYYDEKLKRWRFEGEEDNEEDLTVAPPPKDSELKPEKSAEPQQPAKPSGGVDSLCAPPPNHPLQKPKISKPIGASPFGAFGAATGAFRPPPAEGEGGDSKEGEEASGESAPPVPAASPFPAAAAGSGFGAVLSKPTNPNASRNPNAPRVLDAEQRRAELEQRRAERKACAKPKARPPAPNLSPFAPSPFVATPSAFVDPDPLPGDEPSVGGSTLQQDSPVAAAIEESPEEGQKVAPPVESCADLAFTEDEPAKAAEPEQAQDVTPETAAQEQDALRDFEVCNDADSVSLGRAPALPEEEQPPPLAAPEVAPALEVATTPAASEEPMPADEPKPDAEETGWGDFDADFNDDAFHDATPVETVPGKEKESVEETLPIPEASSPVAELTPAVAPPEVASPVAEEKAMDDGWGDFDFDGDDAEPEQPAPSSAKEPMEAEKPPPPSKSNGDSPESWVMLRERATKDVEPEAAAPSDPFAVQATATEPAAETAAAFTTAEDPSGDTHKIFHGSSAVLEAKATAPEPAPEDPFAAPEAASQDPFATPEPAPQDLFAAPKPSAQDPFVAPEPTAQDFPAAPRPTLVDPFAAPEAAVQDPFAAPEPTAQASPDAPRPSLVDPFAAPEAAPQDPFAEPEPAPQDPFAAPEPASQDPFAAPESVASDLPIAPRPTLVDPFAAPEAASQDPFAAPQPAPQDPFATSEPAPQDSFAAPEPAPQDSLAATEPLAQHLPAAPGPTLVDPVAAPEPAPEDPFAAPEAASQDPFATPEPAPQDLFAAPKPAVQDPFVAPEPTAQDFPAAPRPTLVDPFAAPEAAVQDPFAAPEAAPQDPFTAPEPAPQDPFAASEPAAQDLPVAPRPTLVDPFAAPEPASQDPFAEPEAAPQDPFAMPEPAPQDPFAAPEPFPQDPFAPPEPVQDSLEAPAPAPQEPFAASEDSEKAQASDAFTAPFIPPVCYAPPPPPPAAEAEKARDDVEALRAEVQSLKKQLEERELGNEQNGGREARFLQEVAEEAQRRAEAESKQWQERLAASERLVEQVKANARGFEEQASARINSLQQRVDANTPNPLAPAGSPIDTTIAARVADLEQQLAASNSSREELRTKVERLEQQLQAQSMGSVSPAMFATDDADYDLPDFVWSCGSSDVMQYVQKLVGEIASLRRRVAEGNLPARAKNRPPRNPADVQSMTSAQVGCFAAAISDADSEQIGPIVQLLELHVGDLSLAAQICSAVETLTFADDCNRKAVAELGGVELLLSVLERHENADVTLLRPAMGALWNMTFENSAAERLSASEGVEKLLAAMRRHTEADLQAEACAVLLNLAAKTESRFRIVKGGGIELIVQAMQQHPQNEEMLEHGCQVLYLLASHEDLRSTVGAQGAIAASQAAAVANTRVQKWGKWLQEVLSS